MATSEPFMGPASAGPWFVVGPGFSRTATHRRGCSDESCAEKKGSTFSSIRCGILLP
jgi:hypothetical protein